MSKKIRFKSKILFEIEIINGIKYIKKEDKDASKLAGRPVFCIKPLDDILNSEKEVINLN